MKKARGGFATMCLAVFAAVLFPGTILAGVLEYPVTFELTRINLHEDNGYTLMEFPGSVTHGTEPGHPLVPYAVSYYLIPQGGRATDVSVAPHSVRYINIDNYLYPAQHYRPVSSSFEPFTAPDPEIYSASLPLSDFRAEILYQGMLEGECIAVVAVHPVRYTPVDGLLEIAESMTLRITYENADVFYSTPSLTSSQITSLETRINGLVKNPQEFNPHGYSTMALDVGYRHVILTPSALANSFKPLAAWNTARGVRDTVVTLESINMYPGRDQAEKMRNFVKYAHEEWGVEYLLLGGDEPIVPTRDCYCMKSGVGSTLDEDTIPTDMYFGCLNGDWDANHNNVFGEVGASGDDVDIFAEVHVGRACVSDAAEATRFVDKQTNYQTDPPVGFVNKLMLPSEILWSSPYYPGDATNDAIADMAPGGTKIAKMYETQGTLTKLRYRDSLNVGVGLIHHCAHGNTSSISCADAAFWGWEADLLTNSEKLPVYVAISCFVGAFDHDCLVEDFMNAQNGGTVAWVGNSRYGWGTPPARGPSEELDVDFFSSLYGSDNPSAGVCLSEAKEANSNMASSGYGAWCIYQLNLHGDPALPIHYREVSDFDVTYDEPVLEGQQEWNVYVSSQDGYPVEEMLVHAQQGDNLYAWAYTDASGHATFSMNPTHGTMDLIVSGANHHPWEKTGITVGERTCEMEITPDTNWIDAEFDPLSATFTITNIGTDTLKVFSITPYQTSWITSVSADSFILLADESQDVDFTVDTTGLADDIYLGKIRVYTNYSESPNHYQPVKLIKGDWPDIDFDPDSLIFDIAQGDPLTLTIDVSNVGRADLDVSSITTNTSWITDVSPTSLYIPVDSGTELVSVTVDTSGKEFGDYEGSVIFNTNDPDEENYSYPVILHLGEPDIALSPDTLEFFYSWEDPGKNKTEDDLETANIGDRLLEVTNVIPSRAWILVSPPTAFGVEPADTHDVRIAVHVEGLSQGVYNAHVTVKSNDPDSPSIMHPVQLSIEETPPCISCVPDTAIMDIPTARGTFWVHNLGMRDLMVTKLSSELPWIYTMYPKAFTVRGRDSVQVAMIGNPAEMKNGPSTGFVLIESNDTKNPEWYQPVKLGYLSGIAEAIPESFELSPVTPNPVLNECMVSFAVPHQTGVSVALFDVTGQKVRTFAQGMSEPGYYLIPWRGSDDIGRRLPQGVYILRMEAEEYRSVQKLILLR